MAIKHDHRCADCPTHHASRPPWLPPLTDGCCGCLSASHSACCGSPPSGSCCLITAGAQSLALAPSNAPRHIATCQQNTQLLICTGPRALRILLPRNIGDAAHPADALALRTHCVDRTKAHTRSLHHGCYATANDASEPPCEDGHGAVLQALKAKAINKQPPTCQIRWRG